MEKSLLMLLREEDERVAECNRLKHMINYWREVCDIAASCGDCSYVHHVSEMIEEYRFELADAEKPLAVARAALRKYALEILKAETA